MIIGNYLIGRLEDLFVGCSVNNWDSEGAEPISSATLLEARTLLHLLPERIMTPDFIPERSGRISFEWYEDSERVYLLGIGGTGELVFAGMFGRGNEIHGKCSFSGILPKIVIQHLSMLYSI